jgi:hypothetical protein
MKVGKITPVRCPNGADAIATPHAATNRNVNTVEMAIKSLEGFAIDVFVEKDNDVTPAVGCPASVNNKTIGDGINRITMIRIPSPDPVKVITEVLIGHKRLGIVGESAVAAPDGRVKGRCCGSQNHFNGGGSGESWIKNGFRSGFN